MSTNRTSFVSSGYPLILQIIGRLCPFLLLAYRPFCSKIISSFWDQLLLGRLEISWDHMARRCRCRESWPNVAVSASADHQWHGGEPKPKGRPEKTGPKFVFKLDLKWLCSKLLQSNSTDFLSEWWPAEGHLQPQKNEFTLGDMFRRIFCQPCQGPKNHRVTEPLRHIFQQGQSCEHWRNSTVRS